MNNRFLSMLIKILFLWQEIAVALLLIAAIVGYYTGSNLWGLWSILAGGGFIIISRRY